MISSMLNNPYEGTTLLSFLWVLLNRLKDFLLVNTTELASDEIQIIVLVGVAASSALVGTFLVLRRMTMLANSLSHTILLGIVIVFFFFHKGFSEGVEHQNSFPIELMLLAALGMSIITAFLTEFLNKVARLQEDASTGLVFTSLFALGIVLVTILTRNAHIGTEVVMGNVDALHVDDCKLVFVILGINLISFFLFFKEFKITTFDPGLAKAFGISTVFFNYLLMVQVSATAIGAFRAVGVLMVLAFITGPPLMARMLTTCLKNMLLVSVGLGSFASIIGVAISRHLLTVYGLTLSTGGIVVCTIVLMFLAIALFKKAFSRLLAYK